jgi:hypothetical protein
MPGLFRHDRNRLDLRRVWGDWTGRGVTREEAIKFIVEHTGYVAQPVEALETIGVTKDEIREAALSIRADQRREWAKRLSPDWRGEEMGD